MENRGDRVRSGWVASSGPGVPGGMTGAKRGELVPSLPGVLLLAPHLGSAAGWVRRQLSSCPVLLGPPRPRRAQSAVGGQRAQQTLPQHGEGGREDLGPLGGGRPFIAGLSCSHAPAFAPRDAVKAFGL